MKDEPMEMVPPGTETDDKSHTDSTISASEGSKTELTHPPASGAEKRRTYKNLVMASLSILFHYSSFYALGNLQSSLHRDKGLGTLSLAIIYSGKMLSNIFISTIVIGKIGCKRSIVICTSFFMLYCLANFKPEWYKYTMIPAAIISGVTGGPQMVAVKSYIALLSRWYANLIQSTNLVAITSQFYGIFYMLYGSSEIWGNGLSSVILSMDNKHEAILDKNNLSCGANFCPTEKSNHTNLVMPDAIKIYELCGVCMGFELLAVIFPLIFLDRLSTDVPKPGSKLLQLSLKALQQMKSPKQIILIPILIFRGLQDGFVVADFNLAFVSCTLGIQYVGTTMVCLGVVKAISSCLLGLFVRVVGRMAVFFIALITSAISLTIMLSWTPDPQMPWVFYLLSAFLAIADGVIYSQILALHCTIFTDNYEAAFSNCAIFQYAGNIIAYATSSIMCINHKLYMLLVALILGSIGYTYVEVEEIKKAKKQKD